MKKVLSSIIIILLMIMLIAGFALADKADEYLEPEHTLISSANTDDDGIDGPSMWMRGCEFFIVLGNVRAEVLEEEDK